MDKHFERLHDAVPQAKRLPSRNMMKAFSLTTETMVEPDDYQRSRVGEWLRCAWHGWEFDMRNGQSYFDPARVKVRTYPVVIEDGETLAKGTYVAETFPVHIEDSYVIVET